MTAAFCKPVGAFVHAVAVPQQVGRRVAPLLRGFLGISD
jgi:hypothetical protein